MLISVLIIQGCLIGFNSLFKSFSRVVSVCGDWFTLGVG